jgi:WD repeat-containing protein 45
MVGIKNITKDTINKIKVHDSEIQIISINSKGTLFATASQKGTLIRVFDTKDGTKVREFRRGSFNAYIYMISFSDDDSYLICSSVSGTIHIFDMKFSEKNTSSSLYYLSYLYNSEYIQSEWSCFQYKGVYVKNICKFVKNKNNRIRIFTIEGDYKELAIDYENQTFKILSEFNFLNDFENINKN